MNRRASSTISTACSLDKAVREAFTPRLTPREVGIVTNVSTGIATVSGLPGVGMKSW